MSWQPIETAPKDRTILLYWPERTLGSVLYHQMTSTGIWERDQHSKNRRPFWFTANLPHYNTLRLHRPTHWMPLPPPPGDAP